MTVTRPTPHRRKARRLVRPGLLVLYSALIIIGLFDQMADFSVLHYSLLCLLLILILFELMELLSPETNSSRHWFGLGLWLLIAARVGIQTTGGMSSTLYPLTYLVFALLASALRPGPAVFLGLYLIGIEAGWIAANANDEAHWRTFIGHSAFLLGFGAAVGVLIQVERKGRVQAAQVLEHLKRDVHELSKDDTVFKLQGLTDSGRKRHALRSVFALDEAFYSELSAGRELLSADGLALYWRLSVEDGFHLREIATGRENINSENRIIPGEGFLGWAAGQERPVRSSGRRRPGESLPYFDPPAAFGQALTAPIAAGDWVQGLLVADREQGDEFSEEDEKLIQVLASQVLELHQHAVLLKRSEAETAQSRALAELAHRLSRTLDLDEILDSTLRTSQVIAGGDAQAIIIGDEGQESHQLTRVSGDLDPRLLGRPVAASGSLAGWVMSEKRQLLISDLAARSRKDPVIGKRLDPAGMRSALIYPLPLGQFLAGALVVFSRLIDSFNRHTLQALGILSDLATVSIHNALLHREAQKRAITDGLTGLYNHRWFQERLAEELERSGRLGNRVALIIGDLDHFKRVNDTYGHPLGDEVLRRVAEVLRASIRKVDAAARYGGEEFALILVGTDETGALELAERIRKKTGKLLFHAAGREFKVSLSLGIAVYPEDAPDKERLIELADQALYRAKQTGRNRTVKSSELASPKRTKSIAIHSASRGR